MISHHFTPNFIGEFLDKEKTKKRNTGRAVFHSAASADCLIKHGAFPLKAIKLLAELEWEK